MPHIVEGTLKEYDWGIVDGLARWHAPSGGPQAELWFGTHPAGPAMVVDGPDAGRTLDELDEHRGMPLVKILAAARPLSIQVHPDAAAARHGWEGGSPLYSDPAEKSEMLVALEPFEIHAGWRDVDQAADALARAGASADVVDMIRRGQYREAIPRLLASRVADGIVEAAHQAGWPADAVRALARAADEFPGDPGLVLLALLDHGTLQPGEAIAVPAGVVHSYVGGLGVEVMTTSDNVLRLGLTSKPISIEDALDALQPDRDCQRMWGGTGDALAPDGMPFELTLIDTPCALASGTHRIVLAWEGDVAITAGAGEGQVIPRGRACVWAPAEADAQVSPSGLSIVVTGDA